MKRRLAANTVINYAKTAVVYGLRLALVPVMLDALGPRLFGVYVLVGSITGASDLVQSGLGLSIAKYTAECEAKGDRVGLNRIVSSAMLVSLGLALAIVVGFAVFYLALFTAAFSIPEELSRTAITYALFTLPALLVTSVSVLYQRVLEGIQRYDVLAVFDIFGAVTVFGATFGFLRAGLGLYSAAAASLIGATVVLISAVFTVRRLLPHVRPGLGAVGRDGIRQTAAFSWSAIAFKSLAFVSDRTNPWVIGAIMPSVAALTPYSIAARLHEGGRMAAALAGSAMMPVASGLHAREETERLKVLHLRATKYTAAISLPIILSGIVLADPLIRAWVGPEYAAAVPLAQAYLAYLVFALQVNPNMSLILGMDRQREILPPMIAATVLNVAVSVVLTSLYGSIGVIIGSGIGGVLVCLAALRIVMRELGEGVGRYLREAVVRPYTLAIPVYAALWGVAAWAPPPSLVLVIGYAAVAWAVYLGAFLYYGLSPEERAVVRGAFGNVGHRPDADEQK